MNFLNISITAFLLNTSRLKPVEIGYLTMLMNYMAHEEITEFNLDKFIKFGAFSKKESEEIHELINNHGDNLGDGFFTIGWIAKTIESSLESMEKKRKLNAERQAKYKEKLKKNDSAQSEKNIEQDKINELVNHYKNPAPIGQNNHDFSSASQNWFKLEKEVFCYFKEFSESLGSERISQPIKFTEAVKIGKYITENNLTIDEFISDFQNTFKLENLENMAFYLNATERDFKLNFAYLWNKQGANWGYDNVRAGAGGKISNIKLNNIKQ